MRLLQLFISHLVFFALACNGEDIQGNNNGADYYQKYFEACADAAIDVEDVSLLCDSPGAYYYGNGKYRNNHNCMKGDKGHVSIYFYLGDELQGQEPYVSLKVRDGSGQDEDIAIYDNELLCSISGLSAQDGQNCPEEGYYYISSTSYLGDKDGSGQYFDAVTEIGFRTDPNIAYFDLGGANSEYCKGGINGKYSYDRMRKQVASAVGSFLVTWGTLLFVVLSVTGIAYFLVQRIRRRNDLPFDDADEDLLDGHYNQVIVMSSSRSLVDF